MVPKPVRLCGWLAAVILAGPGVLGARGDQVPTARRVTDPVAARGLPVSLERIRRGVARPRGLDLRLAPRGPLFAIEVQAKLPDFREFVGADALASGPAPATSRTHREFVEMVTPREAQPYGAFEPGELAQVAATSVGFALAGQYLMKAIPDALRGRRERRAREEVAAVVAVLAAREKAAEKPRNDEPDLEPQPPREP